MIRIEHVKPEDAYGIRVVLHKTWLDTYPNKEHGITLDDIEHSHEGLFTEESINKFAKSITDSDRNRYFYVAKDGEKIVGVCRLIVSEGKNQLQMIYVLPEYQGKGIGKLLWNEVRQYLDKGKQTFIEVATYNRNAIKFYEKLGFFDTGRRFMDEQFRMKSGNNIPQMEMKLHEISS